VNVRLFAALRETIGQPQIAVTLRDNATVDDLLAQIADAHPLVRPLLPSTIAAVDEEYVTADHRLRDGDDVALIPPVSGGA
jgi:molybdopterin converting factor subunit 1